MNITTRSKKAFTLLEMVAVLVLILVLAGIAVPTYRAVIGETRDNAAVLSAKSLAKSIDAYAATQNVAPVELAGNNAAEETLEGEMPEGVTVGWGTTWVDVILDFGSDDKCAVITLATTVGGSSTVGAVECEGGPTGPFSLTDTFERVSASGLGGSWSYTPGSEWSIVDGAASMNSFIHDGSHWQNYLGFAIVDTASADQDVSIGVLEDSEGAYHTAFALRGTAGFTQGLLVEVHYGSGELSVYRAYSTDWTDDAQSSYFPDEPLTGPLEVHATLIGDQLTVYVNGTIVHSETLTSGRLATIGSGTWAGFGNYANTSTFEGVTVASAS